MISPYDQTNSLSTNNIELVILVQEIIGLYLPSNTLLIIPCKTFSSVSLVDLKELYGNTNFVCINSYPVSTIKIEQNRSSFNSSEYLFFQ